MLEAFRPKISSDIISRFLTLMILTEKKSARASTLEFGTISSNEFLPSYFDIASSEKIIYQQNYLAFCSTSTSLLVTPKL